MLLDQIKTELISVRIRYGAENLMQADVACVLDGLGIEYTREVRLSSKDVIDFLCLEGVGIECKVKGGPSAVLSQLLRYVQHETVRGLILVTGMQTHRFRVTELNGKPLHVVWVAVASL